MLVIGGLTITPLAWSADDAELAAAAHSAFEAADFDGNGKVSWEEFRSRVLTVFGHLDHNGDGRIAGDEHPQAADAKGEAVQPGNVTAESFTASVVLAFRTADRDGDGELSLAEWSGEN
ncbi:MAG: EF-hand domain-containing protein [Xanthomonadales bacterium]|nr:EF-hand domain-containing protein [Xanthomonadales bacterium]